MIYSCTLFYNEFDLLGVKLREEKKGGVDKVVVVEATRTHQNQPKPLMLKGAGSEVVVYGEVGPEFDKVRHENPRIAALQREAIQRNAAVDFIDLKDDDIVISADVDEIFPAEDIPEIAEAAERFGFVHLIQKNFHYKINLYSPTPWYCPFAVVGKVLKAGTTLNKLRTKESYKIHTNGKHFSFIMTPDQIAEKFKAYSHTEYNAPEYTDPRRIKDCIEGNKDICERERMKYLIPVQIDDSYPEDMRKDKRWAPFTIKKGLVPISSIPTPEIPLHPMPDVEAEFYREVNDL